MHFYNEHIYKYGKCGKISNTKVSDKMTYPNNADQAQTAPCSLIRVYTVCHSTKYIYLRKQMHKKLFKETDA